MYLNIGQGSTTIGNVGGFSNIPYWSSTEITDIQAWSRNFSNGISGVSRKTDAFGVRAVVLYWLSSIVFHILQQIIENKLKR